MLICAPALAGLVAAGASMIGDVFPRELRRHGDVAPCSVFAALLCAWTVAALLVNLLLPAMFALGRAALVNLLAPALSSLHVAATRSAGALRRRRGGRRRLRRSPLCFAVVLLYIGAGDVRWHLARQLARDGLRLGGTAVVSYGAAALLGAALADGIVEAMITAVCGTILYVVLAFAAAAPEQVRLVIRSLRPASAASPAG